MSVVAKGTISLIGVSDAYSVLLQPSNIIITTDPYGNKPNLSNAFTIISLYCGADQVPITSGQITSSSEPLSDDYSTLTKYGDSLKLTITGINDVNLEGWREIEIVTNKGLKILSRFTYYIVRETSMLDWILEWDKNYTEISGDHVATPNAFIGNRNSAGLLSGVYIGQDMPGHSIGIYAVKDCLPEAFAQGNIESSEIFHLNEYGGMIGGWDISAVGLIKSNSIGKLEILSEGTIHYLNNSDANNPFWELKSDGSGSLANKNIYWDSKGNATFKGSLSTKSGTIGGWNIGEESLFNGSILISSSSRFIGILNTNSVSSTEPSKATFYSDIMSSGGIAIFYTNANTYGLEGWSGSNKIFSIGSTNFIAGWNININALYRGTLVNTNGKYTGSAGDITIGSNGIRGYKWYIDADGVADFMDGLVHIESAKSTIAGWNLQTNALYLGNPVNTLEKFTDASGHITIGSNGIRSYSWYLDSTGAGSLAKGKISWDLNGNLFLDKSVTISWDQITGTEAVTNKLTKIDANGVYTGTLSADNITAGTISTVTIKSGSSWILNQDGSGSLASGNITWDANGDIAINNGMVRFGEINEIAGWRIETDRIATTKCHLISTGDYTGLFLASKSFMLSVYPSANIASKVAELGGIYLMVSQDDAELAGYTRAGFLKFKLSSTNECRIASWKFDFNTIYIGSNTIDPTSFFTVEEKSIVLSSSLGILANKWCLLADGSGKLAGGNIQWGSDDELEIGGTIIVKQLNFQCDEYNATDQPDTVLVDKSFLLVNDRYDRRYILPHLTQDEVRVVKVLIPGSANNGTVQFVLADNGDRMIVMGKTHSSDTIILGEDTSSKTGYWEWIGYSVAQTTMWYLKEN